jgi:hypothetical protein
MKLQILKPCMTPEGRHSPGDVVTINPESAAYLVENGYAKPQGVAVETAESKAPASAETATIKTRKGK